MIVYKILFDFKLQFSLSIKCAQVRKNHVCDIFRTISIMYYNIIFTRRRRWRQRRVLHWRPSVRPSRRPIALLMFLPKTTFTSQPTKNFVWLLFIIIIIFSPSFTVFYFERRTDYHDDNIINNIYIKVLTRNIIILSPRRHNNSSTAACYCKLQYQVGSYCRTGTKITLTTRLAFNRYCWISYYYRGK